MHSSRNAEVLQCWVRMPGMLTSALRAQLRKCKWLLGRAFALKPIKRERFALIIIDITIYYSYIPGLTRQILIRPPIQQVVSCVASYLLFAMRLFKAAAGSTGCSQFSLLAVVRLNGIRLSAIFGDRKLASSKDVKRYVICIFICVGICICVYVYGGMYV